MDNDWVPLDYKYYRQSDGRIREEIWCRGELLYQNVMLNFWFSILSPRPMIPFNWDGSCLVTALVKEGPKAMVLYGR